MKKNLTILGAVVLIAAGCASWRNDHNDEEKMKEPAGAERPAPSSTSSGSRRIYTTNPGTNQLNSSGSSSSSDQQRQENPSTQPQ